jgi:hypothetical protein
MRHRWLRNRKRGRQAQASRAILQFLSFGALADDPM